MNSGTAWDLPTVHNAFHNHLAHQEWNCGRIAKYSTQILPHRQVTFAPCSRTNACLLPPLSGWCERATRLYCLRESKHIACPKTKTNEAIWPTPGHLISQIVKQRSYCQEVIFWGSAEHCTASAQETIVQEPASDSTMCTNAVQMSSQCAIQRFSSSSRSAVLFYLLFGLLPQRSKMIVLGGFAFQSAVHGHL